MAFIRVTKPVDGRCTVEYDDSAGRTRLHKQARGVLVAELPATVLPWANEYLATRARIRAARKAVPQ